MKNIVTQKLAYAGHVRDCIGLNVLLVVHRGSLKGRKQEADPEG